MTSVEKISDEKWSRERLQVIKEVYCRGSTDAEFALFVSACKRTGLSPEAKQIYAVKRWDPDLKKEVLGIQTGIDGLRLVAERSKNYSHQEGPFWCGADGRWVDVWLEDDPPVAAKVAVFKKDCEHPTWGIAKYSSFVQTRRDGTVVKVWSKQPDNMLAKCAEAQALRKAFPQECSGLYVQEEVVKDREDDLLIGVQQKLIHEFQKYGVTRRDLEQAMGRDIHDFEDKHIAIARQWAADLRKNKPVPEIGKIVIDPAREEAIKSATDHLQRCKDQGIPVDVNTNFEDMRTEDIERTAEHLSCQVAEEKDPNTLHETLEQLLSKNNTEETKKILNELKNLQIPENMKFEIIKYTREANQGKLDNLAGLLNLYSPVQQQTPA